MKLADLKIGDVFTVGGVEFIKCTDGDEVAVVAKDVLFYSRYGKNGNYGTSDIKERLEKEFLPKIEDSVGSENIVEFETGMTALDGTIPFENVRSKVGLVTLDFYRQNREVFKKHPVDIWWWLATVDSEKYDDIILCVSPGGSVDYRFYFNGGRGVRPFLRFVSSISVS